jgi:hypothetical protein
VKRWFKSDYDEAGISLWDLPFENVENVDPRMQSVIVSECEDQRLIYNSRREIFQLLSRCPESCRDEHFVIVTQFGVGRVLRGWVCLTEFVDPVTGKGIDVSLDLIREWKHACDAQRKAEEQSEGVKKLMRTGDEILADIDKVSDDALDATVAKFTDRFDVMTKSSKVLPRTKGRGTGLILPKHVAAEIRKKRAAQQ